MVARNASINEVRGSALISGCTMAGNCFAEKNTPEAIHIGIIMMFISPEAASIVRTREAIRIPMALNASEPRTQCAATSRSTRGSEHEIPERRIPKGC
jgi:hypothetical protein